MPQARLSQEPLPRPGEVTVTPWSHQSIGLGLILAGLVPTAAAWPVAGLVEFVPFGVPEPINVTKLFAGIGAPAGNIDIGVYDSAGSILVSAGSTGVTATNDLQVADVTDTLLPRGAYYLSLVADTVVTLTILRAPPVAGILQSFGLLEQAGVSLPLSTGASPATFAKYTRAHVPFVGLQGYRTAGP